MIKHLERTHGCWAKAGEYEPVFVLRGQDKLSAALVREWADRAEAAGSPPEKVRDARQLANQMESWQVGHPPKVPD